MFSVFITLNFLFAFSVYPFPSRLVSYPCPNLKASKVHFVCLLSNVAGLQWPFKSTNKALKEVADHVLDRTTGAGNIGETTLEHLNIDINSCQVGTSFASGSYHVHKDHRQDRYNSQHLSFIIVMLSVLLCCTDHPPCQSYNGASYNTT
ncbi:hypothetical protein DFH27DRAFT_62716 [Peziza echinospora]|nr:hypothetical protein DFH27DRAFT_62716 [Peziza echinospora]